MDSIDGFNAENVESHIVDSGMSADDDGEDIPCDDIDSFDAAVLCASHPLEMSLIQWAVVGGALLLICCFLTVCGWCCCCRRREDTHFMNNPGRYDSEFPGAEIQLFDPKKANTVQHIHFVE